MVKVSTPRKRIAKSAVKVNGKSPGKPRAKLAGKTSAKPAANRLSSVAKNDAKDSPRNPNHAVKSSDKLAATAASTSAEKPVGKPATMPPSKPAAKLVANPAETSAAKTATKSATKTGKESFGRLVARDITPNTKVGLKPAAKPMKTRIVERDEKGVKNPTKKPATTGSAAVEVAVANDSPIEPQQPKDSMSRFLSQGNIASAVSALFSLVREYELKRANVNRKPKTGDDAADSTSALDNFVWLQFAFKTPPQKCKLRPSPM